MILKNVSENGITIDIDWQKLKVLPNDKVSVRDSYWDQLLNMYPNYLSVCSILEKGTIEVKFKTGWESAEYGETSTDFVRLPVWTTITSGIDSPTLTFSNWTTVVAMIKAKAPNGTTFYGRDISGFSSDEDSTIIATIVNAYA